jgi:hypothetical protein
MPDTPERIPIAPVRRDDRPVLVTFNMMVVVLRPTDAVVVVLNPVLAGGGAG